MNRLFTLLMAGVLSVTSGCGETVKGKVQQESALRFKMKSMEGEEVDLASPGRSLLGRLLAAARWVAARGKLSLKILQEAGCQAVYAPGINFLRRLAVPKSIHQWTLTTLRKKLIKIGAKVTPHSKYGTFQLAEVAVTRDSFAAILDRIARLATPPPRMARACA